MFKERSCILEYVKQFLQLHQVSFKSLNSVVHLLQVSFHGLKCCLPHHHNDNCKWQYFGPTGPSTDGNIQHWQRLCNRLAVQTSCVQLDEHEHKNLTPFTLLTFIRRHHCLLRLYCPVIWIMDKNLMAWSLNHSLSTLQAYTTTTVTSSNLTNKPTNKYKPPPKALPRLPSWQSQTTKFLQLEML